MASLLFNATLASEYEHLFDTTVISEKRYPEVDGYINKMVANQASYEAVGAPLGIPWYFIAVIHCMEGSLSFKTHLHNGDPLAQRTVQVPKGRPVKGRPPFSWEESATDALAIEGFTAWKDWSIAGMLYCLERYNGIGYRQKGIFSPYLWSFSNYYTSGKYTADGVYDVTAVSKQCGAAVIIRRMCEKQLIHTGTTDRITQVKTIGETVVFNNGKVPADNALQLQQLLNAAGIPLRADGLAGTNTSNAYFTVTGIYLKGDARRA